jgi:signal transduction histidine kinase
MLLVDATGQVRLDSSPQAPGWDFEGRHDAVDTPTTRRGTWQDDQGQTWLFVSRRLPALQIGNARRAEVVFTTPQPDRRQWFRENLARPLLLASGVGLVLAMLLAWYMSRSVVRPLQRVAGAAHAIAQGEYEQTAPATGPTEVRELAQDFNTMAHQVRASRDAQRDFVANVSHELKTPLTSIQGYSQAILDGTAEDPETIERAATVIHDEAARMGRMVTELLDLARIESGQVVMHQARIALDALLENVAERLKLRAQEAGVELLVRIAELPPVTGDGDRLAQVFTNLLDNALKHTPQGGQVELKANTLTPSGIHRRGRNWPQAVEVSVSDSGEGIPAEDLSRIFERFYQVDKSRKRSGSVGLGLAITREIVEAHGGSIKAESIMGLGTRFTVTLPVRAPTQGKADG